MCGRLVAIPSSGDESEQVRRRKVESSRVKMEGDPLSWNAGRVGERCKKSLRPKGGGKAIVNGRPKAPELGLCFSRGGQWARCWATDSLGLVKLGMSQAGKSSTSRPGPGDWEQGGRTGGR